MLVKRAPGWRQHGRPVISLEVFYQYLCICNRKINRLVSEDMIYMLSCNVIQYDLYKLITQDCLDSMNSAYHDDIIKWKHFLHYWPFVRGICQSPVNSPHKGQWRSALMFSLICAWINGWVNSREAGDFRCHHTHYDVTVMSMNNPGYVMSEYTHCVWCL